MWNETKHNKPYKLCLNYVDIMKNKSDFILFLFLGLWELRPWVK